jgi:mRNA interferase MazF
MQFGIILRMISMPNYSKNIVILVRYPFSDLSNAKVRPAVIINAPHSSQDILIVPLTSKIGSLLDGEFVLNDWAAAGLNVVTAVKRGKLADVDIDRLDQSLRGWLGL